MNIRLMGVLFGILAIAVIGQTILRGSAQANFWSAGSRRNREGGGGLAVIMVLSFAVMAIGYIGVFFGRLIQSAISRQREFLADAAAVQFTRNPGSIGGALKKSAVPASTGVSHTHMHRNVRIVSLPVPSSHSEPASQRTLLLSNASAQLNPTGTVSLSAPKTSGHTDPQPKTSSPSGQCGQCRQCGCIHAVHRPSQRSHHALC